MSNTTKPSGTSTTKPLESLTFFTDQDTSCEDLITVLIEAGARVVRLKEIYPVDQDDETWIEECSKKGWIILSRNKRIRYVSTQLQKIITHKGRAFFIISSKPMTGLQMADRIAKAVPKMRKVIDKHDGPWLVKLQADGVVVGWYGTCETVHF
jgi:hypothetical protein